ncbi:MAG TPA: hypothetical protein VLJ88_19230 [Propionibacteriaceae bacterium]|nr:hypothetical protein [Propionibacteriaceae bacterium]
MLTALLKGHWYDAVGALLVDTQDFVQAQKLAAAARRVLELDAEDFTGVAHGFDAPWAGRLAASSFPAEPHDPIRGALASLVPLYELMLEVLQVRAIRREPLQVVVTAHLIGEFLAQLAWESTLGHGGDPLYLADFVGGSRWGTDDPICAHSSSQRSTAHRALNAAQGDSAAFTTYLDRFHSRQGDALSVCAMNHDTVNKGDRPDVGESCPNPCDFVTGLPTEHRRDLDARVRLALVYAESPIVALRHHAPVGHFFGVPSFAEIDEAWQSTWEKLVQPWPDGGNPLLEPEPAIRPVEPEPLPGMALLVSTVAGHPVGPGRLLRDIGHDVAEALGAGSADGPG